MIIDREGLFNGNRWRKCSVAARLHAPYLLLAANGFARMEIDPLRIIAKAYATFNPRPTEKVVMGCIREYVEAHLMFLYDHDGQHWGQWDTPERLLQKYKTAEDKRSPPPPEPAFTEWRSRYPHASTEFARFPRTFGNFSEELARNFPSGVGVGEGVGVGVGDGKNICSSNTDERVCDPSNPTSTNPASDSKYKQIDGWFDQCWSGYWRKVGRKAALKAFRQRVTTEETFKQVLAGIEAQRPTMLAKEEQYRVHFSTFVNGERWLDEVATTKLSAFEEAVAEIQNKEQQE